MLKQKLKTSFISKIFVQFLQMAATIIVARIAGPTVLGTIAFGLAFVGMFGFLNNLGLGSSHVKIMHEGYDKDKCVGTYTVLAVISKILFLGFAISYYLIQKYVLEFPFESREHEIVILIFIGMIFFNTFSEIPQANLMAEMEQAKLDIPEIVRNLFLQPARIIVVLLGGLSIALASINLISAVLVIPIYLYFNRNYKIGKFDKKLARRYLKYSAPLLLLAVATTLSNTIDKVLLQYLTNSEIVGYYTAGFRIGGYFLIIGHSAGMLFYPYFSKLIKEKKEKLIKEKIGQYERFIFLFVMPLMIFLAIYSKTIVMVILGDKYIPSIDILTIITLAQFLYLINIPYGNVLTGLGLFKLVAVLNIIFLIIYVVLMVLLVDPRFANLLGTGAAYAFLISRTILVILYVVFAHKKMPIFDFSSNARFFTFGFISFIVFFLIYTNVVNDSVVLTILFPIAFFVINYIALYLFGWINRNDWDFFLSAIKIKPMIDYIRGEIHK
ncbi:MAG TPA: oligosaccharide flippase family protein [Bacteroidales bacterium]